VGDGQSRTRRDGPSWHLARAGVNDGSHDRGQRGATLQVESGRSPSTISTLIGTAPSWHLADWPPLASPLGASPRLTLPSKDIINQPVTATWRLAYGERYVTRFDSAVAAKV
jgi:hypothetical protein